MRIDSSFREASVRMGSLVVMTNALVLVYGFREKARRRYNTCHHLRSCPAWCCKLGFICTLQALVTFCTLVSLLLLVLSEAVCMVTIAADATCSTGMGAVDATLGLIGIIGNTTNTVPLEETCETLDELKNGAFEMFLGSVLLVLGQGVIYGYWMKYSALSHAGVINISDSNQEGHRKVERGRVMPADEAVVAVEVGSLPPVQAFRVE